MNNFVSKINFFTNNDYPPYIFDNNLRKFVYNILSSKIKPATAKKKLI